MNVVLGMVDGDLGLLTIPAKHLADFREKGALLDHGVDGRDQTHVHRRRAGGGCGGHFRCIYPNMTIAAAATDKTTAAA